MLWKYSATQGFLLVAISRYQIDELKQITQCCRRYMQFDIAFVSTVKFLVELLKLSNFLSLYPPPSRTKTIFFWFQTMKNDLVWRKVLERFITILNLSVNIIGVLFFQLVSTFEKLQTQLKSLLTEELELPEQQFNMVYASIYF